jgi:N-acetylneuraminic acid mutarotase
LIITSVSTSYSQGVWEIGNNNGFIGGYGMAATVVDGKIYTFGGQVNLELLPTVNIYDPAADEWTSPDYSGTFTPRRMMTANYVDGKIYVIGGDIITENGGSGTNIVEVYDPLTNEWTVPSTTGTMTARRNHASVVYNDKIYLFGGCDGNTDISTVDVFDPKTLHWTNLTTSGTFTPRRSLSAALINGKAYVYGGATVSPVQIGALDVLEIFDLATNTWSTPTPSGMVIARRGPTACAFDGKMYIFGGNNNQSVIADLELYNPVTEQWSSQLAIGVPTPRNSPTSVVIGNKLYFIGGAGNSGYNVFEVFIPEQSNISIEGAESGFQLYPSVTSSSVNVLIEKSGSYYLTINNLVGEMVHTTYKSQQNMPIDVSQFPSGIYFVRVQTNSEIFTAKFIKH